jgi:hypothetical protein
MPLVLVAFIAGCIQAATANQFASNAEVASLSTALHRLETKFERQGVAMQVQLDAQQEEILALKADRRGKEQRIESIETMLVQHAKALDFLSAQDGDQQTRISQCEENTAPFVQMMKRRRMQEETLCRAEGLAKMLATCCPSQGANGNGHRRSMQQVEGCNALPSTCSAACAPLLIEYFEGCQGIIDDLAPDERQGFQDLYGNCQEVEQATAAMLQDAKPAMMFHVLVLGEGAAQEAEMFGGAGRTPAPPPGTIDPLPPPRPAGAAGTLHEFRRVCTTMNLATCVPECNAVTYGFLLSIEIDGRGTVMTCNKMLDTFSWQGQASLGGYIGSDFAAFLSSVVCRPVHSRLSTHTAHTNAVLQ